jgi:hypothetical protein
MRKVDAGGERDYLYPSMCMSVCLCACLSASRSRFSVSFFSFAMSVAPGESGSVCNSPRETPVRTVGEKMMSPQWSRSVAG